MIYDGKWHRYQHGAAEAARDAGAQVYFDPATERLVAPGLELPEADYATGAPYDVEALTVDADARARLVAQVIAAHPKWTTAITPAHFYVHDERSADLNVVLAEDTRRAVDQPVRATIVLSRPYGARAAVELAQHYREAGIDQVELRISPLGGDDVSLTIIRSVFAILDAFAAAGLEVTLGLSGNIGHAAVAFGHAEHYSVGVGLLERVNHAATIQRQSAPPRPVPIGADGAPVDGPRGAVAGIYLPGPAATVTRTAGKALLSNTNTRIKVGCRIGPCATSINGPGLDPREHYVHARAGEMASVLDQPARWRVTHELERLRRAIELREIINIRHLGGAVTKLGTRTLRSLMDDQRNDPAVRSA